MIILDKQGTLYSTARCTGGKGCGMGRVLEMYNTLGEPSEEIIARLNNCGEWHERKHRTHTVEVTIYRVNLEPIKVQQS